MFWLVFCEERCGVALYVAFTPLLLHFKIQHSTHRVARAAWKHLGEGKDKGGFLSLLHFKQERVGGAEDESWKYYL